MLVSSIFVIAMSAEEALEPLQGQLELEAQSREAIVAYATTTVRSSTIVAVEHLASVASGG